MDFLILVVIFSPQPEPLRSAELAGHKDTSAVHHDKPNRLPPLKKTTTVAVGVKATAAAASSSLCMIVAWE